MRAFECVPPANRTATFTSTYGAFAGELQGDAGRLRDVSGRVHQLRSRRGVALPRPSSTIRRVPSSCSSTGTATRPSGCRRRAAPSARRRPLIQTAAKPAARVNRRA